MSSRVAFQTRSQTTPQTRSRGAAVERRPVRAAKRRGAKATSMMAAAAKAKKSALRTKKKKAPKKSANPQRQPALWRKAAAEKRQRAGASLRRATTFLQPDDGRALYRNAQQRRADADAAADRRRRTEPLPGSYADLVLAALRARGAMSRASLERWLHRNHPASVVDRALLNRAVGGLLRSKRQPLRETASGRLQLLPAGGMPEIGAESPAELAAAAKAAKAAKSRASKASARRAPAAVARPFGSGGGGGGGGGGFARFAPSAASGPRTQPALRPSGMLPARSDVELSSYNYGREAVAAGAGQLDVCFALDVTGSMSSTLQACKQNIRELVAQLTAAEGQDVRFALIPYRDHARSNGFCTKVYPFTRDVGQMQINLDAQHVGGGGDYPEAVTAALFEAVCLPWREGAAKLIVFMADAGPHGLGEGSEHPGGDPDGKDPLALAREAESLGLTIYSLIVGGCTERSRWFFGALSAITGGKAMALPSAAALGGAILAGARENLDLERSIASVRGAVAAQEAQKGRPLTDAERAAVTQAYLQAVAAGKGAALARNLPADKLLSMPEDRLEQALLALSLWELRCWWEGRSSATGAGAGGAPRGAPRRAADAASRIARAADVRDARSTEKVVVQCFAQGSKVRVRVVSEGYDGTKNCQFPRDLRAVGKRFLVDQIIDAGSFYRAKGEIVPFEG